jgi:small subunit ribosomal protein S4
VIADATRSSRRSFPWLEVDRKSLQGKFLSPPNREDIPENIREQLIVELYSK